MGIATNVNMSCQNTVTELIRDKNQKNWVHRVTIFLDLSKAFDTHKVSLIFIGIQCSCPWMIWFFLSFFIFHHIILGPITFWRFETKSKQLSLWLLLILHDNLLIVTYCLVTYYFFTYCLSWRIYQQLLGLVLQQTTFIHDLLDK